MDREEMEMTAEKQNIWFSEMLFPLFTACLAAGVFAGTHMYYVHHIGAFNEIAIVAMLQAGIEGAGYGAAAAFGASFLFARILEGPLVGILDIGGSIMTGVGIGIPAILLSMGLIGPLESFPLALVVGGGIGAFIGGVIIFIRRYTVAAGNSTFGADIMMGAGNASGRYLGPLIVIAAASASIPVGIGASIGAAIFYAWKKPIAGGAILGAMLFGSFFPIISQ